jgi:NADPH-dependent 2,4-dienoyl-CoA reductase/sulfur reductase-like enzyme
LLATGGSPLRLEIPGASLPNVHYLRSLGDVDRLHKAVDKAAAEGRPHARGRGRAAVIGGGVLGVELAASLTQMGIGVDLFVKHAHPWSKFSGTACGAFLSLYLQRHGVEIHAMSPPRSLEGDGRVQWIRGADGIKVETDFVVVAVGTMVNKELLRGSPIAAEKAILTDAYCQSNVPGIFAAGDCAAIFDPLFGKHRIVDHWDNAQVTGALAGRNMAGVSEPYSAVNSFFTHVFDLSVSGWGEARLVDRRLLRGTPDVEAPDFVELGVAADGRIAQALAVGHHGEDDLLRELVRRRVGIDGHEEAFRDPERPLSVSMD